MRGFLLVQWLRPCTWTAGDCGSIAGWETKIPYVARCGKKTKIKQRQKRKYMMLGEWLVWLEGEEQRGEETTKDKVGRSVKGLPYTSCPNLGFILFQTGSHYTFFK